MNRVIAALVVLGVTRDASAQDFVRTVAETMSESEVCVTWNTRRIVYVVDAAGSERTPAESEFLAITSSFATWQAVSDLCSDFVFSGAPRQDRVPVGKGTQDINALVFRERECDPDDPCQVTRTCANALQCWDHGNSLVIALTTTSYSARTGLIYDADIEFNASRYLFTTVGSPPCDPEREAVSCVAYDVQNAATHEIGHVVGFNHVSNVSSTMARSAPLGDTQKRIIDFGTQEGFCSTYPRGQPPVPCDLLAQAKRRITAKNAGTFGCACSGVDAGVAVGWAMIVWGLRRRRLSRRCK